MNLCYLCAPLLMQKAAIPQQQASVATSVDPRRDGRVPYNIALLRALESRRRSDTAAGSSPETRRRLSIGGILPLKEGMRGGELRGRDLVPDDDSVFGTSPEDTVGLCRSVGPTGQITLLSSGPPAAQCLVCRAGVSGWLRVYTG